MVGRISTALVAAGAAIGVVFASASPALAQGKSLTLCWAAWDPANALVELGKDFTAKTGIEMKYEFVPWTSYADRMLNELNSHSKLCDLIIGDSQWIGGAAENGHYVKLNDFFAKEGITMDDFMPATVVGYSEWPKNTPNYWALPAMADAVGWTYRKDWFSRPELQAEFKKKYGPRTRPAQDVDELKRCRILPGPQDRRQEGLWRLYLYRARLGRHHHGRDQRAVRLGLQIRRPEEALSDERFRQFARRGEGPGVLQGALQGLHAARHDQCLHAEGLDAFKSGQVAMQMNWFAFFPGLYKDPNVGGDKIGFFVNPRRRKQFTSLADRASRSFLIPTSSDEALQYIKWFAQPAVQQKWWELGGYSALKAVVQAPGFVKSAPFAADFLKSMEIVKDFWAEPAYAELLLDMQKRVHDYVVADKGTAKEALDLLVKDWKKVFKEEGKI